MTFRFISLSPTLKASFARQREDEEEREDGEVNEGGERTQELERKKKRGR